MSSSLINAILKIYLMYWHIAIHILTCRVCHSGLWQLVMNPSFWKKNRFVLVYCCYALVISGIAAAELYQPIFLLLVELLQFIPFFFPVVNVSAGYSNFLMAVKLAPAFWSSTCSGTWYVVLYWRARWNIPPETVEVVASVGENLLYAPCVRLELKSSEII